MVCKKWFQLCCDPMANLSDLSNMKFIFYSYRMFFLVLLSFYRILIWFIMIHNDSDLVFLCMFLCCPKVCPFG